MYEELAKSLRTTVMLYEAIGQGDLVTTQLMMQAADAIDELDTLLDGARADNDALCETIEMLKKQVFDMSSLIGDYSEKTRWIPVTERLPEQKINQNTLDFEYVLCATTFGDVRPYKFGRRIGQGESHFWNGNGYVDAYITHWMPLPEPPTEKA